MGPEPASERKERVLLFLRFCQVLHGWSPVFDAPSGADHLITYAPERIREAVLAGVTAWLDAGVVVIQAREGITEREFGRFRRRGIPSLTVQGLRQQGFRGRSDSKSGTTPRRKASTESKPSHFSGEVV